MVVMTTKGSDFFEEVLISTWAVTVAVDVAVVAFTYHGRKRR